MRPESRSRWRVLWCVLLITIAGTGWTRPIAGGDVQFRRGDVNNDGRVSLVDAQFFNMWLGLGGPAPPCFAAADADGNGQLEVTDAVLILLYLFLGSAEIPPPFPECGVSESGSTILGCEAEPVCGDPLPRREGTFRLFISPRGDADAPAADDHAVPLVAGRGEVPVYLLLSGSVPGSSPLGASGWSTGVAVESEAAEATIIAATTAGTAGAFFAEDPRGRVRRGFSTVETTADGGAVSAAVIDFLVPRTLDPDRAEPILRITVRLAVDAESSGALVTVRPAAGLVGSGAPVDLEVTAGGEAFAPDVHPLVLRLLYVDPEEAFIRGDSNRDGALAMADAVFTLEWLFRGGAAPPCEDAADANDDGNIDISDALFSLGCLFLGTSCTPPPAGACGTDPTDGDSLSCEVPGSPCE